MTWRTRFIATLIVVTTVGLLSLPHNTSAESMKGGPYAPDGLRIPNSIQLLSDTAYYPAEDTPTNQPEGWFSPQLVKVLATYGAWSTGGVAWKIETMFGARWIHPKPWEIDIAPPKRIYLKDNTPLYRRASEKGGSIAALTPQEVEVVSAEKQWFYTNDPSSPAWIQIHTTWMGDLWAHIPVQDIGTIQSANKHVLYRYAYGVKDLDRIIHGNYEQNVSVEQSITHTLQTYTTIYNRYFLIDSEKGPFWVNEAGLELIPTDEILDLTTERPLFSEPSNNELAVLSGEKVHAFEKITDPLWQGRGPYEVWHFSTWYHVETSKGIGWINLLYGEPNDAAKVNWKMSLHGLRNLLRYPDIYPALVAQPIDNREVDVSATWRAPNGSVWLKTEVDGFQGWIPYNNWDNDRFWDLDAGTVLQIEAQYPQFYDLKPDSTGNLHLNEETKAGYMKDGKDILQLKTLAETFAFTESVVNSELNTVRYTKDDYSFVLHEGKPSADIYWKDVLQKSVTLSITPYRQSGDWYLEQTDVRLLLGASIVPWSENHAFYTQAYNLDPGELPTHLTGGKAQLNAFLYDTQLQWSMKNLKNALNPQLSIEEKADHGALKSVSSIEITPSGTNVTDDTVPFFYRLSAECSLAPGPHDLYIVLRVGERILWKQPWHVVMD